MEKIKETKVKNLYVGVRGIAVKILNRIERTDAYLDKLLDAEMRHSQLSSVDKALLFEIVHGVIRQLGYLDWILTGFYKGMYVKCIPNVKNAMRVGLYQILFLDKIPTYAAINESVEFVKKIQGKKSADLTNAVLRNIIRNKENIRFPDRNENLIQFLSAFYSHPIWLVKRWLKQYGEEFTESLLQANNAKPSISLRVNKIKTNKPELKKLLKQVEIKFHESKYFDEYLHLQNLSNIQDWAYFKKGYLTIQDESTAFSVKFLDPQPGERVLDMCAAPGGKTSFLADLMKNKGEIVALDLYDGRLEMLRQNMKRLGVNIVKTVAVDLMDFNDNDKFDKILADVPCSGLGTLTKKPDIKWKRYLGELKKLNDLQLRILQKAATLVRKNGYIVYSTCSIDKDENWNIVNKFLQKHDNFELINASSRFSENLIDENNCVQTFPNVHKIDGAFAAKLKKID